MLAQFLNQTAFQIAHADLLGWFGSQIPEFTRIDREIVQFDVRPCSLRGGVWYTYFQSAVLY